MSRSSSSNARSHISGTRTLPSFSTLSSVLTLPGCTAAEKDTTGAPGSCGTASTEKPVGCERTSSIPGRFVHKLRRCSTPAAAITRSSSSARGTSVCSAPGLSSL
jgi:hypothetical protein